MVMTYSTPITLGTTYYNCPEYLNDFVEDNIDYVDHLIIVDDGSEPSKRASLYLDKHSKISLYEVTKDVGFNSHGCRNLIMKECWTYWCVLLDIDRKFIVPDLDWHNIRLLIDTGLYDDCFFSFAVHCKPSLTKNKNDIMYPEFDPNDQKWKKISSPNDLLINKDIFWSVGGYDEECIGFRYGDREFHHQANVLWDWSCIMDAELKFTRGPSKQEERIALLKIIGDFDRQDEEFCRIKETIKKRKRSVFDLEPNKPTLTFPWRKIF